MQFLTQSLIFASVATAAVANGRQDDIGSKVKARAEVPQFDHDPRTIKTCTWWWDNDGSVSCEGIPSYWAITDAQWKKWVSCQV